MCLDGLRISSPEASEIEDMWSRWVQNGAFDGNPSSPRDLAHYLADAHKEGQSGWERVHEALRSHVRTYVRSGDKNKIVTAMDHIEAAADAGAPVLNTLLCETEGVSATAEWEEWEKRDPDTAEFMRWYVFEVSKEAIGDRNWLRPWESAKKMVEFQDERRRRILTQKSQANRGQTE
jgi:hypothetical protein